MVTAWSQTDPAIQTQTSLHVGWLVSLLTQLSSPSLRQALTPDTITHLRNAQIFFEANDRTDYPSSSLPLIYTFFTGPWTCFGACVWEDSRPSLLQGLSQTLLRAAVQVLVTVSSRVHPVSILLPPRAEYCVQLETGTLEKDVQSFTLTHHRSKIQPMEGYWLRERCGRTEILCACDYGVRCRQLSWGARALEGCSLTPGPVVNPGTAWNQSPATFSLLPY